jgi:hypothetical protein
MVFLDFYKNRCDLPDMIAKEIDSSGWKPDWKNQLVMQKSERSYSDSLNTNRINLRIFHIDVCNFNSHKHARNCYAFIERIENLATNKYTPVPNVELKWSGYMLPYVTILPNLYRDLDAFFILQAKPHIARFSLFTDSSLRRAPISGPGDYDLTYLVVSDNFEPVEATFRMHLANALEEVTFEQIE